LGIGVGFGGRCVEAAGVAREELYVVATVDE
jgi:hypothetical protein